MELGKESRSIKANLISHIFGKTTLTIGYKVPKNKSVTQCRTIILTSAHHAAS